MGRVYVNNYASATVSAISNSQTSIVVTSATGLPTLTGTQYYYLTIGGGGTYEIVKVTARSGTTLTVVRAQESTTGVAWSANTPIKMSFTAGSLVITTSPTENTSAHWDSNLNITTNNTLGGYATTATAAGTTTLTVASAYRQFFTGTTTQTVVLPMTSTLTLGHTFEIINNSTGTVTVNSSGSNLIASLLTGTKITVTCILTSGTTAASWSAASSSGGDSGGAWEFITSKTASSSTELAFTDIGDYSSIRFIFNDIKPATDAVSLYMQTSTNNGSSYDSGATDYSSAVHYMVSSGVWGSSQLNNSDKIGLIIGTSVGNSTGEKVSGEVILYNPAGTDHGLVAGKLVFKNPSTVLTILECGASRNTGADIDAVRFYFSSGNIASGAIYMYGIKKSASGGGGGGSVDSVNGQTGTVVLDADDIDDTSTTQKFVTSSDLTKLSNLSGTNSGDQNIFSTIAVSGQSNVVADTTSDTLTLVAGTNITITTDAATDTITIDASGGGGGGTTYNTVSGTTQTAAVNNGYVCTNAAQCNVTLPATAAVGSIVIVVSQGAGGIKVTANTGQTIKGLGDTTTSAGSITPASQYDSIEIVCVVANTTWVVRNFVSSLLTFA